MLCTKVSLSEFTEEVADMLRVCFEGTVYLENEAITLTFTNRSEERRVGKECRL